MRVFAFKAIFLILIIDLKKIYKYNFRSILIKNYMKKLFLLCFILVLPGIIFAQVDCPFGFVDDSAPGSCARYIDTDGNSICDLSEVPLQSDAGNIDREEVEYISAEDLKSKTVKEAAEIYKINPNEYAASLAKYLGKGVLISDLLQDLHDEESLCAGIAAEIALSIKNGNTEIEDAELISGKELKEMKVYEIARIYNISEEDYANELAGYLDKKIKLTDTLQLLHDNYGLDAYTAKEIAFKMNGDENIAINIESESNKNILPRYKFGLILVTILILYLLSYLMVKTKKISLLTHRRLWNVLLLITFLASIILGLLLIIRVNWGWSFNLPFNKLYWHVEFGTAMAIISFFHIIWHWRYFALMFRKKDNRRQITGSSKQ